MHVGMNELEIVEENAQLGLRVAVVYIQVANAR
jgi:hypothetical protein